MGCTAVILRIFLDAPLLHISKCCNINNYVFPKYKCWSFTIIAIQKLIHKNCKENNKCPGVVIKMVCSITYFALASAMTQHTKQLPTSVLCSVCFHCHMYFVLVHFLSPPMSGYWSPPLCVMITLTCFVFPLD